MLLPPKRFITPKPGNRPNECEDQSRVAYPYNAFSASPSGVNLARLAVCDGASESAFAQLWAATLAQQFISSPPDLARLDYRGLMQWLAPAQQRWYERVPWERLPWHGEAKAREGAFATLLGLQFQAAPGRSPGLCWQAVAVGDSCLFLIRDGRLVLSFPMTGAAEFGNTPPLVGSVAAANSGLPRQLPKVSGQCAPGDLFLLATDALAEWLLREYGAGREPWRELLSLQTPAEWEEWLAAKRSARQIKHDDTTLLIIPTSPMRGVTG